MENKHLEEILKNAKQILLQIDKKVDDLEGDKRFDAMNDITLLLADWNLLGTNFASYMIQDWMSSEETEK